MALTSTGRLLVVSTALMGIACDCRVHEEARPEGSAPDDSQGAEPLHDGEALSRDQRQRAEELIALLRTFYPTWDPERESLDSFYARYYDSPEIQRLKAHIDEREADDRAWRSLLANAREALGRDVTVSRGTPPKFYIPSFQVVVFTKHQGGSVTMVYRLSMLAPLYDYYQTIRGTGGNVSRVLVTPTRDVAPIDRQIRRLIAEHFPHYREISPQIAAVRVPNLKAGNLLVNETSIGQALFEDRRTW